MSKTVRPDQLHRLVKMALDTGEAQTLEEAERLFAGYRLGIDVGRDVAGSPTLQAAVLTAVNAARRSFLGGVHVAGELDVPLRLPWGRCRTLGEAVRDLRGQVVGKLEPEMPSLVVAVDQGRNVTHQEFAVRATFEGWAGGVVPLDSGVRLPERQEFIPAGVLAGALGVSEAFQFVRRGNSTAGRRDIGLSLWQPESENAWLTTTENGPLLERLPSKLWLIGLGHLGQAFLWTLGLLPYGAPDEVQIVLQDYDALAEANDSTSLLTRQVMVGEKKTRAMANWCEARGFQASIFERRFAGNFKVASDEPSIALCGVDNALARAALEDVGFSRIIEAGLGAGRQEYLAFQLHTFPARRSARERWGGRYDASAADDLLNLPAYRALAAAGVDRCGLIDLVGRTVGAPFVGAATATLVVAELLRMVIGEHSYEIIDGSLRSLVHRQTVRSGQNTVFNPGATWAT